MMDTIPKNVKSFLKKLNQSEDEFAQSCLDNAAKALKSNGYQDAQLWASNILQALIPELEYIEEISDLEEMIVEMGDGLERDVFEAVYETFVQLQDTVTKSNLTDIRDSLVYTVSKMLSEQDQKKYSRLYG